LIPKKETAALIIYKLPECTPVPCLPKGAAVALGNFDGVHRGHQRLFDTARKLCEERGFSCSAAWTFTTLAKPVFSAPCITDMEAKLSLFAAYGLDYAVFEEFERVKDLSSREFVSDYLTKKLAIGCAVCGFNFRFGKGGMGDAALLRELLESNGSSCRVLSAVIRRNRIISSSAVREAIIEGDMDGAYDLLGHAFSISFPVVRGNQLGRTIGIPTINQAFPEGHIIPKKGIYACTCYVGGEIFLGVANVGTRPTVSDSERINCETHIINYNGLLYGKEIKVEFYKRLRDEIRFSSLEALKAQISEDIQNTLDFFCTMYGG